MTTIRDLIEEAEKLGYTAEPTNGSHVRFTHSSGALVHVSGTPSDRRGWQNARSDLRRELRLRGVEVEVRKLPPKEERARAMSGSLSAEREERYG
jgi:predicted RNA binding protein YcfA (HicA-like mRNA interferase family)